MSRFTFMTINFLLFHTCWMATAYGAGYGWDWLGPAFVVPSLVIHLSLIGSWYREGLFIMIAAVLGFLVNSFFHSLGFLLYSSLNNSLGLAPYWMFFLWLIFASLFHGSLQWMHDKRTLQIVLGLLLGPFAYLSAEALGALTIGGNYWLALLVLSLAWGMLVPFLSWLAFQVEPFSQIDMTTVIIDREGRYA